jgi:hypothetical protein
MNSSSTFFKKNILEEASTWRNSCARNEIGRDLGNGQDGDACISPVGARVLRPISPRNLMNSDESTN